MRARRVFYEANGAQGPWTCYGCDDSVMTIGRDTWDGNIHHLDGDVTNDVPDNLVMMHAICHQRLHGPPTLEQRAIISAKLKGRPSPTKGMKFSAETNAKKSHPGESNPFFGQTHTPESLQKMRKPRQRIICPDCGRSVAINWVERHKKEGTGCTDSPRAKRSPGAST
jgi:hypothetical protein